MSFASHSKSRYVAQDSGALCSAATRAVALLIALRACVYCPASITPVNPRFICPHTPSVPLVDGSPALSASSVAASGEHVALYCVGERVSALVGAAVRGDSVGPRVAGDCVTGDSEGAIVVGVALGPAVPGACVTGDAVTGEIVGSAVGCVVAGEAVTPRGSGA